MYFLIRQKNINHKPRNGVVMLFKITAKQMGFKIRDIIYACRYWANFNGFTGERCGHCKKTANVLAGSSGWFCPCGHHNVLSFHGCNIPHARPDCGPTRRKLRTAYIIADQLEKLREFKRSRFFNSKNFAISLTIR